MDIVETDMFQFRRLDIGRIVAHNNFEPSLINSSLVKLKKYFWNDLFEKRISEVSLIMVQHSDLNQVGCSKINVAVSIAEG